MDIYSKYVSGRKDSDALIVEKMKTSPQFNEIVNAALKGDSGDFIFKKLLLLPMQRITQYSLLIKELKKYSIDNQSDESMVLSQALNISNEIIKRINDDVGRKEDVKKLEWLEEHVPMAKAFGYRFLEKTNFMGDRKLIYYGSLIKESSSKELYAFLLNDSLIFIEAHEQCWSEIFRPTTNRVFNMYKIPILLENIKSIQCKHQDHQETSFILSTEKDHSFRTTNPTLKNEWIKQIQKAIQEYRVKKQSSLTHVITPTLSKKKPIGRLLLVVLEGQDLNIDLNNEEKFLSKKPFCEAKLNGQKFATHFLENTQNPKWNTAMQFQLYDLDKEILSVCVYDSKPFVQNAFLGKTHISVSSIYKEQLFEKNPVTRVFRLADTKCGKVMLKMNISIYK